jgi:biofilm PGA synthesis protein PgaA
MRINDLRRKASRGTPWTRFAFGLCLALVLTPPLHAEDALLGAESARHEQAIAWARAGQYDLALGALEELRTAHPTNRALLNDSILVLGWAERDQQVLDLATSVDASQAPLEVARTIAKGARNRRMFGMAAIWYEHALARAPADVDSRIGMALALADGGDATAAQAALDALDASARSTVPVLLAGAYLDERSGDLIGALAGYEDVLELDPTHYGALRGKALVLRSLLLPGQALELAAAHPGILTEPEIARLRVDEIAVELRLAGKTPYPPGMRGELMAQTVAALDEYLAAAEDPGARNALGLDRVVALADANRYAEAVAAFEALPASENTLPPFVALAVSEAYRGMERPADSLHVLEPVVHANPRDGELAFALIHTYLDLEEYAAAYALTERLTSEAPLLNTEQGSTVVKGNPQRLRAELVAGVADAYGDQLAAAQTRFETLLADAPNNLDLRHELANVYRWRQWLDRALFEYAQVLTVDADLLSARIGYGYAQIDAHRFPEVETTVAELTAEYGDEPAVQRLAEEWNLHNRSELTVVANNGESSGSTFGTDYYRVDTYWYTRPYAYRWRGLVHLHDAYAEFPEGESERQRIGFGTEYRAERWTATGEISGGRGDKGDLGARGAIDWRLSDAWTLAGLVDLDSNDVPLRGARVGVAADVAQVTALYTRHESLAGAIGTRFQSLSDGNAARYLFANGRQRIVNRPRWKVDVMGEVAASGAERDDVVYFSPTRDTTVWAGLRHEGRLFRRYDRSLVQTASVAIGRYDQSGYSAGEVWRAEYGLTWQPGKRLAFGAGLERARMRYDGAPEYSTDFFATVRARL